MVATRKTKELKRIRRKKVGLLEQCRLRYRYDELDFTAGISDEEISKRLTEGLNLIKQQKAIKGLPISKFDVETGKAYLQFPDGRVEYVD